MISSGLPSVGIRHLHSRALVSWGLTYSYGSLGMLYTEEPHRSKHLARKLLQKLVQRWCEIDWQCAPFAYSVSTNYGAHAALVGAGFHKRGDCCWFAITKE
jgi:GNAT superfamily N-acetyltransferase